MSYNVKNTSEDTGSMTDQRVAGIKGIINANNPDIVGFTEMDSAMELRLALPGYSSAVGGTNVLQWQTTRFSALSAGSVDLLAPGEGGTHPDCASQNRHMVWASLDDLKTEYSYFVVMTHLSTSPGNADCLASRQKEAERVMSSVNSLRPSNARVIVMGDLNTQTPKCSSQAAAAPLETLVASQPSYNLNPTVAKSAPCDYQNATMNANWDASVANDVKRIDYILADSRLAVSKNGIDKTNNLTIGGAARSPSDHYAVWAVLTP
jgi:endonuclease/exonuclease/phosphatase family metal-dependent hydrolase